MRLMKGKKAQSMYMQGYVSKVWGKTEKKGELMS